VGHRLEDGIVEFDGARDEQGVVRGLGRHGGLGLGLFRGGRKNREIDGFIFDVVGCQGVSLGREGSVKLRQRQALIQMSGNQAEALRGRRGRQLFRFAADRGVNSGWKKLEACQFPEGNARERRGSPVVRCDVIG